MTINRFFVCLHDDKDADMLDCAYEAIILPLNLVPLDSTVPEEIEPEDLEKYALEVVKDYYENAGIEPSEYYNYVSVYGRVMLRTLKVTTNFEFEPEPEE